MQEVGRRRAHWKKGAGRVPRSHRHLTRSRCLLSVSPTWPRGPWEANANLSPRKSCSLIGLELLHLHLPSGAVCLTAWILAGQLALKSQAVRRLQLSRWSRPSSETGVVGRRLPPVSRCLSWSKLTPCRSLSRLLWEVTAAKSGVRMQHQLPGVGQALAELRLLVLVPWLPEDARPVTKRRVSTSPL